ncbi:MAG: hypothetical protein QNL90_01815 [Gammaproteobacteria bacterium]|nr:hypothetical protein [Gammaproteobacteria bacterium]MDX2458812.1 hypothetical protein [Gammaproteobacteria bacterium]
MRVLFGFLIWICASGSLAQSVHLYKSVHGDGSVGYSDTQPADAESITEMKVHQDGAATEQGGAQTMQELEAASTALDKKNAEQAAAKRKYQSRLADARAEVSAAEGYLVTTQQSRKHATPERVEDAQTRLRLAKQRLGEVRRAGP